MKNILIFLLSLISIVGFNQTPIPPGTAVSRTIVNDANEGCISLSGTDTYTATVSGASYVTDHGYAFKFTNGNATTSPTINLNGAGPISIRKYSAGSLVAVAANDLKGTIRLRYDGTFFVLDGIGNSGAGSVTSVTGTPNQIASSGGTTPVLSIVTNPILPGSPTIASPGNSTQNIITTDATQTLSNKTLVAPALGTIASGDGAALTNVVNSVTGDGVGGTSDNPVMDLTSSRTLTSAGATVQGDNLHIIYLNSVTPFNLTIDQLTINTQITLINVGAATVTLVNGTGVTYSGGSTVATDESAMIIYKSVTIPLVRVGGIIPNASTTLRGIAKLYTSTGTNIDGSMDQNSITAALATKSSSTLTSAHLFVGSAGNVATDVAVTGDVNITNAGVTAIGPAKVTNAMLAGSIDLTSKVAGLLPYANLSNGAGLSVVGRSANTSGVQADIAAASDNQILRRSGNSIGFGSIDLSQSNAVGSSILPIANGGTGSATAPYYTLASGGMAAGVNTYTSNANGQIIHTGAWTSTADAQKHETFTPTITMRPTSGDIVFGKRFSPAFVYTATNQEAVGLDLNMSTSGVFTGTTATALRVTNGSTLAFRVLSNGSVGFMDGSGNQKLQWVSSSSALVANGDVLTQINPINETTGWNFTSGGKTTTGSMFSFSSRSSAITAGQLNMLDVRFQSTQSFNPSSGTSPLMVVNLVPTYNQTGTASGAITGLMYNPTITAILGIHYSFVSVPTGTLGGVGAAAPTSTWQVSGSFAGGYVAKTSTYSATVNDYTIECTSGTFTVTLPTAVGITGRIYNVVNSGAGTITVGTTSSQTFVNVAATPTTLAMATVGTTTVQSNGANWLKLSGL